MPGTKQPTNNNKQQPPKRQKKAKAYKPPKARSRWIAPARLQQSKDTAAKNLAMLFAMPTRPFRLPTVTRNRTAVAHIKQLDTYDGTVTQGPGPWGDDQDKIIAFFGQPGRAAMIWQHADAAEYEVEFGTVGTGMWDADNRYQVAKIWEIFSTPYTNSAADIGPTQGMLAEGEIWPAVGAIKSVSSGDAPHGNFLPAGISEGNSCLFLSKGDVLRISYSVFGVGLKMSWVTSLQEWQGYGKEPRSVPANFGGENIASLDMAGASGHVEVDFEIPSDGYYAMRFTSFNVQACTLNRISASVKIIMPAKHRWCSVAMQDFLGSTFNPASPGSIIGADARVNGASLLVSNITPEMYRGGSSICARVSANNLFYGLSKAQVLAKKDPVADDAGKGIYTFMENTVRRQEFRPHSTAGAGALTFDLDDNDLYHIMVISPPDNHPQTFQLTFEMAVEYKTDCAIISTNAYQGPASVEDLARASALINQVPQWFFENPMHMSDIYGWVLKGARGVARYGPAVAGGLAAVAPQASAGIAGLVTLLKAMGVQAH